MASLAVFDTVLSDSRPLLLRINKAGAIADLFTSDVANLNQPVLTHETTKSIITTRSSTFEVQIELRVMVKEPGEAQRGEIVRSSSDQDRYLY